jgi:hypothetical protein
MAMPMWPICAMTNANGLPFQCALCLSDLTLVVASMVARSFRPNRMFFLDTNHARPAPQPTRTASTPRSHGARSTCAPAASRRAPHTRTAHIRLYAPATPCLSRVSTFPLTNNSRSRAWHTGSRRSSEWAPPCAPGAPPPASAGGAALQPRGRSPPRATEQ